MLFNNNNHHVRLYSNISLVPCSAFATDYWWKDYRGNCSLGKFSPTLKHCWLHIFASSIHGDVGVPKRDDSWPSSDLYRPLPHFQLFRKCITWFTILSGWRGKHFTWLMSSNRVVITVCIHLSVHAQHTPVYICTYYIVGLSLLIYPLGWFVTGWCVLRTSEILLRLNNINYILVISQVVLLRRKVHQDQVNKI